MNQSLSSPSSTITELFAESRLRTGELRRRRVSIRLANTFVVTLIVMMSPISMLANPASATTSSFSTNGTPSSPSIIGQDGGSDFTTQAVLSSVTAKQTNNIVNTKSYYDVIFVTATTGSIKTVQVTFPVGTSIGETDLLLESEGIGAGTAAKMGSRTIT